MFRFDFVWDLAESKPGSGEESLERATDTVAFVPSPDLTPFFGMCAVLAPASESDSDSDSVGLSAVKSCVAELEAEMTILRTRYQAEVEMPPRFLVRTRNAAGAVALDPTVIDWLYERGALLVGSDCSLYREEGHLSELASKFESLSLPGLFGLNLEHLEQGYRYNLLAGPLKVENSAVTPVRPLLVS